jgi:cytochrome P450
VYLRVLGTRFCLLSHPDAIEYVLVRHASNFLKSRDYRALRQVLGKGLLTSEGDPWQKSRKLIQPAFRRESIASYADIIMDSAARAMNGWRDGETRDIHQDMMGLTLEIVAKCLFGSDVSGRADGVGRAVAIALKDFPAQALLAFILPESAPVPRSPWLRRATKHLDDTIYSIVRRRRTAGKHSNDLLQALLDSQDEQGAHMTDQQLRDELMTLFLAGHETTANALTWTWFLLSQDPAAEQRLHEEIRSVLGDRPPSISDLPRLAYAEMVMKESLRLYPPAYAIGRLAIDEFELNGYRIPAKTNLIMLPWVTHRDPRFFPNPERFDPERWREDAGRASRIPRFAYFPFGGGPRVCVGAGFAMMEAILLLAAIAQHFTFKLAPGNPVAVFPSVTLRPKDGMKMIVAAQSMAMHAAR